MRNLISAQFAAVALILALQCGLEASAQIDTSKLDNNLQPNLVPAPVPRRRTIKKFVRITEAPPETVRYTQGSRLELECVALGKPAPSVEWLKNGEPMSEFNDESNELITVDASSFATLISKVVIDSAAHEDEFTCVATNGIKRDSASTTVYTTSDVDELLTIRKLLFKPAKPVIISYFSDIFQNLGTDLILPCRVFSPTNTQVIWQDAKNNMIYENSGRMRVLSSGDLLISGLRWADMGNFTCIAKNMHGKDTVFTFVYPLKTKQ